MKRVFKCISWEIRDIRPELQNKAKELRAQLSETTVNKDFLKEKSHQLMIFMFL